MVRREELKAVREELKAEEEAKMEGMARPRRQVDCEVVGGALWGSSFFMRVG